MSGSREARKRAIEVLVPGFYVELHAPPGLEGKRQRPLGCCERERKPGRRVAPEKAYAGRAVIDHVGKFPGRTQWGKHLRVLAEGPVLAKEAVEAAGCEEYSQVIMTVLGA